MGDSPFQHDPNADPPNLEPPAPRPPSLPPPLPVQALNYVTPGDVPHRPAAWVALGIFSLLIGLLSILNNFSAGVLWYKIGSASIPPRPFTISLNPAAPMTMVGGRYVSPHGTPIDQRAAIIAKFNFQGLDADDRNAILERLLAERGSDIFPNGATVSISPATTQPSAESPAWGHGVELVVPGGTVSVAMADATFKESSESTFIYENTVRQAAANSTAQWPRHYNALAIEHAIADLSQLNPRMTDAQRSTIADLYSKVLIPQSNDSMLPLLPAPSGMNSAGVLQIEVDGASLYISPDGKWIEVSRAPTGIDPSTGRTAPISQRFVPVSSGSPWLMFSQAGLFFLNILVGILLMTGGVLLFGNSPLGAVVHYRWVSLKVFMMVMETVLAFLFFCSVLLLPSTGGRFNFLVGIGGLAESLCYQAMYPIVVVIVLRLGTSRNYLWSRNVHLTFLEKDKLVRARAFLKQTRLAWVPAVIGCAVIVVGIFHLIATYTCLSRSQIVMGFFHFVVSFLALGLGFVAIYSVRRSRSKSAIAVLLAISAVAAFSAPARAEAPQTAPTTQQSPEDAALAQRIATDLNGSKPYEIREKDLEEIAAMGEAPVKPILENFAAGKVKGDLSWAICRMWKIQHVPDSPAVQQLICEYVLKIYANNPLAGKRFFDVLPDDPKLLDFWSKLVFDPKPELAFLAAERIPAIDPKGESVLPRLMTMLREAKDLPQQVTAFRLLGAIGIAGQNQFLELFHDRDATIRRLAVAWVNLGSEINPLYEGLMATILDPTQGLDGTPEQLADAKQKIRKAAIASLWYRSDDPDHQHALSQLTDPRIIAAHLGNEILLAGTRDVHSNWIRVLQQPDSSTVDDWSAVQHVAAFTFHAMGRASESTLINLLDSTNPRERHLALLVMAEMGPDLRANPAVLLIKADVNTAADKAALVKILKPHLDRSITVNLEDLYMEGLTRTYQKDEIAAITKKLVAMGMKGKRAMANPRNLISEDSMHGIFDALSDSSAFAWELKTVVFNSHTTDKEFERFKMVLNAALDEEGNFGRGAMRLLQSRDPSQQQWMAQTLLDLPFRQLIGPATCAKCQTILSIPIVTPRPAAMTTAVPEAEPEITWSDWTWRFSYILCLLTIAGVAACYVYAFYAPRSPLAAS